MSRTAAALLSLLLLLGPLALFAQNAPICEVTCTPDPTSPSYSGTLAARPRLPNARGSLNPRVPRLGDDPVGTPFDPPNPSLKQSSTLPGSESYNYSIPILHRPGRNGLDLDLTLYYNSHVWTIDTVNATATFNADQDWPSYGFRLGWGVLEYDPNNDDFILTMGDGSKELLTNNGAGAYVTTDGTLMSFGPSWLNGGNILRLKNGTWLQYIVFPNDSNRFRVQGVTDSNGNDIFISYRTDTWATGQEINTVFDTAGNQFVFNYDANHRLASITQGTKTWATFTWGTATLNYSFSGLTVTNTQVSGSSINVLSACTYANGTGYGFVYGDWGIVNSITRFSSNFTARSSVQYNYPPGTVAQTGHPTYTQKTVNDGVNSYSWGYVATLSAGVVTSLTVSDPSGARMVTNLDPNTGLTSSVQWQDPSGSTLRTAGYTWTANNQVQSVTTTLSDTGQQSKLQYAYNSTGLLSDVWEYDYGLVLKRHTTLSYLAGAAYVNQHILDRVAQKEVMDGTGNVVARTDLAYDGNSLTTVTGAANHLDNSYPATFTTRGNLTTVTRYANAGAGSGAISRSVTYNTLGNSITAQLDCCNQKMWNYSTATQYIFPDSIVRGPAGLQFTTGATYDTANGLVLSSTDENGQVTHYTYNDPMNRLTAIARPDGVSTNFAYNDAASLAAVTTSTSANNLVTVSTLNGAGQEIQGDVTNAGTLVSTVKTSYDGLGRAASRTNPYGPGETPASTAYSYDALGRLTTAAPPSGGSYTYAYSGNFATTTDPAGKQRRSYTDALGRLVQVDEPGGPSSPTPGSASLTVSGSEQSSTVTSGAAAGTGSVTITGSERSITVPTSCKVISGKTVCTYTTYYDTGTVSITVNGITDSVTYNANSTPSTIASALASAINADAAAVVTASASSIVVSLTAKQTGVATDYSLSAASGTTNTAHFPAGSTSFSATTSGSTLAGGANGTPVTTYDSGTVTVTVNGFAAQATYGQTSTAASVANDLNTALNGASSPVTATLSGSTVTLTSRASGAATNYTLSYSAGSSLPGTFAQPSFSAGGPSALSGGTDGTTLQTPNSTFYAYDVLDDLTQVSQGVQTRSYAYDSLGRLTSSTTPESGTTNSFYTTAGGAACAADASAVCYRTDARNITSTYTYDGLNRVTGVSYSDGTAPVSYTYDAGGAAAFALGRLTSVTVGTGTPPIAAESYSYDQLGRITMAQETVGTAQYNVGYGYNPDNTLATITYPSRRVVAQSYDPIGRLTTIASNGTSFLSGLQYNAAGQALGFNYGNGVQAAFSYNDHLQLASLRYSKTGAPDLLNLGYEYTSTAVPGNNGQIQKIHFYTAPGSEDLTKSENFSYDAWGRLATAATGDGTTWGLSESYDRYGNRLAQNVTAGSAPGPSVSVDPASNRINSAGYAYDAAGNMINDTNHTYTYDAMNWLTQVDGGATASYTYLGALRVKKVAGATTTVYVYSKTLPIAEYTVGAAPTQPSNEYIYSGTQLLATIASTGAVTYRYRDHLSNRVETDASGNITRTFGQFPYGEVWYETGTTSKWKFASYERDSESGLDYAQARHYSFVQGRFLQPDLLPGKPTAPQSLNRYAYVVGDPINAVDPSGMECVWDDGSFDSEGDPDTGSVGPCQEQGGTWIELGQGGNWSGMPDATLENMVQAIQQGIYNIVSALGADGTYWVTHYDSNGRVDWTAGGGSVTTYGYFQNSLSPVGSRSYADPTNSVANGFSQWLIMHPGLPLDPNERYLYQLAQQITFLTTHPITPCEYALELVPAEITVLTVPPVLAEIPAGAAKEAIDWGTWGSGVATTGLGWTVCK